MKNASLRTFVRFSISTCAWTTSIRARTASLASWTYFKAPTVNTSKSGLQCQHQRASMPLGWNLMCPKLKSKVVGVMPKPGGINAPSESNYVICVRESRNACDQKTQTFPPTPQTPWFSVQSFSTGHAHLRFRPQLLVSRLRAAVLPLPPERNPPCRSL